MKNGDRGANGSLGRLRDAVNHYGWRMAAAVAAERVISRGASHEAVRRWLRPTLMEVTEAGNMVVTARDVAQRLDIASEERDWCRIEREYAQTQQRLATRVAELGSVRSYAESWQTGGETALALYAVVASQRPEVVLESGVASGRSTFVILRALEASGSGSLVSTDISSSAGELLRASDSERWRFVVLADDLRKSFRELVEGLPCIDVFFHDSLHEYAWQTFEYRTVVEKMPSGSILIGDDAHSCAAYLDVCRNLRIQPTLLVNDRRVSGFARLP